MNNEHEIVEFVILEPFGSLSFVSCSSLCKLGYKKSVLCCHITLLMIGTLTALIHRGLRITVRI